MKHIVFVVGNFKNGGVARHAVTLANEFAKKGYMSTILVTKKLTQDNFFEQSESVNVVSLEEYVNQHSNDASVKKESAKTNNRIRLIKLFRHIIKFIPRLDKLAAYEVRGLRKSHLLSVFAANNPNCIYIPFGLSYFVDVFFATKKTKSKIIYAERTTPLFEFSTLDYSANYLFKLLKKTNKVVLQTQASADFYNNHIKNYCIINNPIKDGLPKAYSGVRRKCVTTFCRISEEKNLPLLFDAFIRFHKTHPDYKLEIYGNVVNDNEKSLLELYHNKLLSQNETEYISIFPARADVHNVVRDCTMFVSSSDYEGLSNSMIEAMAIGLPCVCTDCLGGGAREVIKNNDNGLIVPVQNPDALCDAMCKIADNSDLAKRFSENAQKIRDDLCVEKIAKKWLAIIENL